MLDVRNILDGQVWPRNVHDFGGDVTDILMEQLEGGDSATIADAAQQLFELFRDDELLIRSYAVLAIGSIRKVVQTELIRQAVEQAELFLKVAPVPIWQISHASLWEEALYRLSTE
jgi:hypothetical protein